MKFLRSNTWEFANVFVIIPTCVIFRWMKILRHSRIISINNSRSLFTLPKFNFLSGVGKGVFERRSDDKTLPSLSVRCLIWCAGRGAVWVLSFFFIISAALWKGRAPFFYEESTRKKRGGGWNARRIILLFYLPTLFECKHVSQSRSQPPRAPSCDKPNKLLHSAARARSESRKPEKAESA